MKVVNKLGWFESIRLFRQVVNNDLSGLVDISDNTKISLIQIAGKKVMIPGTYEVLHELFKRDQKSIIKTPKAQYYTTKAMGKGLITTDKEEWVKKRKHVKGLFNISEMNELMEFVVAEIHCKMRDLKGTIDLNELCSSVAVSVIGRIFFGEFTKDDGDELRIAVARMIQPTYARIVSPVPFFVDPLNKLTAHSRKIFFNILSKNIKAARISSKENLTKKYYPEGPCIEDVSNIFAAGYETTANAVVWLLIEIEKNKQVKTKLSNELNAITGFVDYQDLLRQIPYLIACVKEILRIYPPAWILGRTATEKICLKEFTIPKNTDIVLSPYIFHRLNKYWDNPSEFKPEKFYEDPNTYKPYYFPFGIGLRSCIGERLALMEIYLTILTIFNQYSFTIDSNNIKLKAHFTLRPTGTIKINLKKKNYGKENAKTRAVCS